MNRRLSRGTAESHEPEIETRQEKKPRKGCLSTWARLLAKVYQVDPLVCSRCGKRMSVAGFVMDAAAIARILEHLGQLAAGSGDGVTTARGRPPELQPVLDRVVAAKPDRGALPRRR